MAYGRGRSGGYNSGGGYGGGRGGNQKEFDNRNRGAFWEVDRRDKRNEKSPDLNGKININGEDFWISGWYQRDGGGQKPVIRFALGDPCNDSGGRRDDYDRNRPRDDGDRGGDRGGRGRDDRNDDRRSSGRDADRYDNRREREEDDRRARDDEDRRRSDGRQAPFDGDRRGGRGGSRGESGHDDGRNRPGPNDRDGGPAPEGPGEYDKDLDDELPF
jgi:hypothetical protein